MKNHLPEFLGVLFALLIINAWYLSGIAIEEGVVPIYYDHIIRILTVAGSAAFGATLAFKFNHRLEDIKNARAALKEKAQNSAVLNKALLNIAMQLNTIDNMKKKLSKYNTIHEKAFAMNAEKNFRENAIVDINEIALILTSKPQLLLEINNEQDGYLQTIESFKVRNEHYLNILQPKMYELGLLDRKATIAEYEAALPTPIFKAAYQSVSVMEKNILESEQGLMFAFQNLRNACKEVMPEYEYLQLK
ncbi:hypothetical protein D3C77_407570 [compost metagenome]